MHQRVTVDLITLCALHGLYNGCVHGCCHTIAVNLTRKRKRQILEEDESMDEDEFAKLKKEDESMMPFDMLLPEDNTGTFRMTGCQRLMYFYPSSWLPLNMV